MNKSERQIKLLLRLQSNRYWKVDDIAKEFDITRRTVFRDINELKKINSNIEYVPDLGYRLSFGSRLQPIMFETKELCVLAVALSFMKSQPINSMKLDANSVSDKINNAITGDLKDYLHEIEKAVVVDPFSLVNPPKPTYVDWYTLSDAIVLKKNISFTYKGNNEYRRHLSPYAVVYYQDHWNIIGYDQKRMDIRNFQINAIQNLEVEQKELFEEPKTRNLLDLIIKPDENDFEVLCNVKKEVKEDFISKVPAAYKLIKETNEYSKFSFTFNNLSFLAKWFLQFSTSTQVIEPQSLIDQIKKELNNLTALY